MKFILAAVLCLVFSVVCLGNPIFQRVPIGKGAVVQSYIDGPYERVIKPVQPQLPHVPIGNGAVVQPYIDGGVGPYGGAINPVQPPLPVGVNIQGSEHGPGVHVPIGNGAVVQPYINEGVGPYGGAINPVQPQLPLVPIGNGAVVKPYINEGVGPYGRAINPVQPPLPLGVNIQGSEHGPGVRVPIGKGAVVQPYINEGVGPYGGAINPVQPPLPKIFTQSIITKICNENQENINGIKCIRFYEPPYFISCIETPSGVTFYTASDRSLIPIEKYHRPPNLKHWIRCFGCKNGCIPHCAECNDRVNPAYLSVTLESVCARGFIQFSYNMRYNDDD
uniref:Uncharacterized protein n=1 Tax=Acrobeloides nanus TaxID=290746 RepID=A0A914DAC2_9BILA